LPTSPSSLFLTTEFCYLNEKRLCTTLHFKKKNGSSSLLKVRLQKV
jgi:hypothetical protein